jgi:outer membrane protein assembly factor BamB
VFVTNNLGLAGFRLTVSGSGTPGLQTLWSTALTAPDFPGSSPLVANGVLFDAHNNLIEARDPVSGRQLWQDTSVGGIHWEHPVVANGMLYITDQSGQLTAYGLPSAPGQPHQHGDTLHDFGPTGVNPFHRTTADPHSAC